MSRLIHRKVAGESRRNRSGLILLVVLGMLALFSMLAVTYVVFASQSRSTSMALARRETRGHKSHRAIMDSAMMALIRGTGPESSMFGHSLLGDFYGAAESQGIRIQIRNFQFDPTNFNRVPGMAVAAPQRPMLLNGHFLRIPVDPFADPGPSALPSPPLPNPQYIHPFHLPAENDALNGRIVTFPEGNGPLSGQSFHIVRYLGQTISNTRVEDVVVNNNALTDAEFHLFSQSYSITIDLNEANLQQSYVSGGVSGSLADWISAAPAGRNVCYSPSGIGFQLLLNGTALNAHGVGILADGSSQLHHQDVAVGQPVDPPPVGPRHNSISEMATTLLPNYSEMGRANLTGSFGTLTSANPQDQVNPGGNTHVPFSGQFEHAPVNPASLLGDADEPYDAPDYNNMHMAYRAMGATDSTGIIPAFHRPALINYIINWKKDPATNLPVSPNSWTEAEFLATMRRIEMATLRPLAYSIRTPSMGGAFVTKNPRFTGGNAGGATATPTLLVDISGNWSEWASNGYWANPSTGAPGAFQQWVNSLVLGPWDVDSDLDGIADAQWMDPNLPLETSPDGKLLKVLVSYYVDDLDSKLDINATGSLAQVNDRSAGFYAATDGTDPTRAFQFAEPTPGIIENSAGKPYWDQGTGYGPADVSFRHLFASDYTGEIAYRNFIMGRYLPNGGLLPSPISDIVPGRVSASAIEERAGRATSDALADMASMRERAHEFRHLGGQTNHVFPPAAPPTSVTGSSGLPLGPHGRISIGLDPFGNPRIWNLNEWPRTNPSPALRLLQVVNETVNDPYEATLIRGGNHDSPYSIAEWERIYRVRDADRALMPERLQAALGLGADDLAVSDVRRWITPYSRAVRQPGLSARSGRRLFDGSNPFAPLQPPFLDTRPFVDLNNSTMRDTLELTPTAVAARGEGATSLMQMVNTIRHMRFQEQFTREQILDLFPLEFTRGERMNLNRAFGNGVDDDGDFQVDEPNELAAGQASYYSTLASALPSIPANVANRVPENYFPQLIDPTAQPNTDPFLTAAEPLYFGLETRQMFARHLYCLAQLIVPDDYVFPNVNREYYQELLVRAAGDPNNATTQLARAKYTLLRGRILAQWAVNVVDFRDGDSAMTRFVYDPDPFRDASFNHNPAWEVGPSSQTVVWGMEAPEALLTESLAFHDVKVRQNPYERMDEDFHQFRTPQGSLFLEMYFPKTTAIAAGRGGQSSSVQGVDEDLYGEVGANADGDSDVKLNLAALAPAGTNINGDPVGRVPVWRVYISESVDTSSSAVLQTPNERLMDTSNSVTDVELPHRHDMSYQLTGSNEFYGAPNSNGSNARALASGLMFDHFQDPTTFNNTTPFNLRTNPADRLPEVDETKARVILFTNQVPTLTNTPGVVDPEAQVFRNPVANMNVRGGEYLVIGPRPETFFGSRRDSKGDGDPNDPANPVEGDEFINSPNVRRLQIGAGVDRIAGGVSGGQSWLGLYNNILTNVPFGQPNNVQGTNWMVAQQDLITYWPNADDNVAGAPHRYNGINVSEPLINDPNAYGEPTTEVNPNDMTGAEPGGPVDPLPPGFDPVGFSQIPQDAYHDWSNNPAGAVAPFDQGHTGTPLEFWDPDSDGVAPTLLSLNSGADDVVAPGTQLDFCTAYLQRLADPQKPFHETFNPYITVDWIPIDLTVFNGEDYEGPFDPSDARHTNDYIFASRQKIGQTLNATTHEYEAQSNDVNAGGNSFYSAVTDKPLNFADNTISYEIDNDPAMWGFTLRDMSGNVPTTMPATTPAARPSDSYGSNSGMTLGFLNSTYNISTATAGRYIGGPQLNNLRPDALFWTDRQFVNPTELMMVPLSAPGQFLQEFSTYVETGTDHSVYAADFKGARTNAPPVPDERSVPTSPVNSANAANGLNTGLPGVDDGRYMPYSHLMNFLQEVPELRTADAHPLANYFGPTTFAANTGEPPLPNPKNLSMMSLLEMVETPSPWSDSNKMDPPGTFQFRSWSTRTNLIDQENASSNIIFSPYRAPYNRVSTFVEPGRVNLNTVAERAVWQGMNHSRLPPADIDYPPRDWVSMGMKGPEDIDHNMNGTFDNPAVNRTTLATGGIINTTWTNLLASRQGYVAPNAAMLVNTYNANTALNPFFPTRFANPFRPSSEAGMVPKTWSALPLITTPTVPPQLGERHNLLAHESSKNGVLDVMAKKTPAFVTTLRPIAEAPPAVPESVGMQEFGSSFLFSDSGYRLHPYSDTYQASRLQNLTTGQSHVYAVYMTVGFFEYDPASDSIGVEYGANSGESERYRGFFVVDRTIPVGFQVGEDHNAANTILVKRYLKARD